MRRLSENGTIGLNDGRPAVRCPQRTYWRLGILCAEDSARIGDQNCRALVPSAPAFDTNAATMFALKTAAATIAG